jgi:hypothetical protein
MWLVREGLQTLAEGGIEGRRCQEKQEDAAAGRSRETVEGHRGRSREAIRGH